MALANVAVTKYNNFLKVREMINLLGFQHTLSNHTIALIITPGYR
jgi:hypothetical protein